MLTMRPIEHDGSWGAKSKKEYVLDKSGEKIRLASGEYKSRKIPAVDWNEQHNAEIWRAAWQDEANTALERSGSDTRINHKNYARQGLDIIPTIHLGMAASQMERKGIRTERGDINREIMVANSELRQLKARIKKLNKWIAEESRNTESPTFADVISDILSRQGQIVVNAATTSQILDFLEAKQIQNYAGLEKYLQSLMGKQSALAHKLTPARKKLAEVTERINQYSNYKERKAEYDSFIKEYNAQLPWKRKAFEDDNRLLINNYEESKKYIGGLVNNKNQVPILTWKKEHSELSAQLQKLKGEHESLKAEVSSVDKIRVQVYDILRRDRQREQPQRAHGMEL